MRRNQDRASTSSMGGGEDFQTLPFLPPLIDLKKIFKGCTKRNPKFQFNLTPLQAFDSLQSHLFIYFRSDPCHP
jgi:hypothetical protein